MKEELEEMKKIDTRISKTIALKQRKQLERLVENLLSDRNRVTRL